MLEEIEILSPDKDFGYRGGAVKDGDEVFDVLDETGVNLFFLELTNFCHEVFWR